MAEPMTILFDLDGTLTDPAAGIVGSVRHALAQMGRAVDPGDDLLWAIGPPIRQSFARLLETDDPEAVETGIALYRERYGAAGLFEATAYEGVPEVLEDLAGRGHRLFLATSKAHVFARRILDHFGLSRWFAGIHGAELDGTNEKKPELLAHILATHGLDPSRCVMVGDRVHDAIGAEAVGMPFLWAAWGYGTPAEFPAPPTPVARPGDLPALLARSG